MTSVWISAGTYLPTNIINPIYAACEEDRIPDEVYVLTPDEYAIDAFLDDFITAVAAEFGTEMTVTQTQTGDAQDFKQFNTHFRELLDQHEEDNVAIDLTGGPEIYPALMFREVTLNQLRVNHIYYLQYSQAKDEELYQTKFYPELPTTAIELHDITEVMNT
jgi:hypothetical protein